MKNKLIRTKSQNMLPPFSLEKIAKKIKCGHLVKSFLYKYVDPLIQRRSILFKKKNNGTSNNNSPTKSNNLFSSSTYRKLHYLNIQLKKKPPSHEISSEDFTFNPKFETSRFPKERPYMIFLDNNLNNEKYNVINTKMFEDLNFTKEITVNSIYTQKKPSQSLPDINQREKKIRTYVTAKKNSTTTQKYKCPQISRLWQIAGLSKLYATNNNERNMFVKDESNTFLTNTKNNLIKNKISLSERNKDIINSNKEVTIDCVKSSAFGDISPDKIVSPILLSHKIVSIDNKDKTYHRIKALDDKLKQLVHTSHKRSKVV